MVGLKRKAACFVTFFVLAILSIIFTFFKINSNINETKASGLPKNLLVESGDWKAEEPKLQNFQSKDKLDDAEFSFTVEEVNPNIDPPGGNETDTFLAPNSSYSKDYLNSSNSSSFFIYQTLPSYMIDAEESDSCLLPRPVNDCQLPKDERIHIIFVSAMWYREPFTKVETKNSLKSIIYQTKCPLLVHFLISGEPEESIIPAMMKILNFSFVPSTPPNFNTSDHDENLWKQSANSNLTSFDDNKLLYTLHYIPSDYVIERAKALFLYPLAHHAGIPGMAKFFIADILWQVKRAIYLDVDMIIGGDIQDMWNYFKIFDIKQKLLYYMGNNNPEGVKKRKKRPYCSCQLILDLERIRKVNLTNLLVKALRGRKPKELRYYAEDGDQWLFMWVCKQYKGRCRILPIMWNVSGCSKPIRFLGLGSRSKEVNGTCWRIVHFNCLGHVRGKQGSYLVPGDWKETFSWLASVRP